MSSYIIKETPNVALWKVVPYDSKPYYVIIQTINLDSSVSTILTSKLRIAIRKFNKLKRRKSYELI